MEYGLYVDGGTQPERNSLQIKAMHGAGVLERFGGGGHQRIMNNPGKAYSPSESQILIKSLFNLCAEHSPSLSTIAQVNSIHTAGATSPTGVSVEGYLVYHQAP